MSATETVKADLEARFPALAGGAVRVSRERRVWIEVGRESFEEVFRHLVKNMGFTTLCTITGLDEGADLGFIYHLAADNGVMANVKTRCPKAQSVKTVIEYFPGANIYERELEDLLGAHVDGLPEGARYPLPDDWPTDQHPLLKDWKPKKRRRLRPWRRKERPPVSDHDKIMQIPIGPQHPALKEPESFMIDLRGEKIDAVHMRFGYNHRGIEKGCEQRSFTQDLYLVERICGICSYAHSTAFVQAVEEIAGLELPARAQYIRTIIAELERIHSHLLWLGVAGHEIGFDTLLMYTWRDREQVMILLAQLTGNRVNYGLNTIGGVRRDITAEQMPSILKVVDSLEERTRYYIELAQTEETLRQRLANVGKLTREDALRLGAVGPTARASGVDRDTRRDDPYGAYGEVQFKVVTAQSCDVYGRTVVRLGELMEAYSIIRQLVKNIPDGPILVKAPRRIPAGEAVSRYEAPRGEDVHYVRGNGTEKPERVKVRAPTLANTQSVAKMLEDGYLADLPIVIAAIDPCFSCTDRMIAVKGNGENRTMSWDEVSRYGVQFYKRKGIDFSRVVLREGPAA